MSDGPHRSLPMRKPWKAVAELGHARFHGRRDRTKNDRSIGSRLARGGREPTARRTEPVRRARHELPMFSDMRNRKSRGFAAQLGKPLALTLVKCVDRATAQGATGDSALEEAARRTLALHVTPAFARLKSITCGSSPRLAPMPSGSGLRRQHRSVGLMASDVVWLAWMEARLHRKPKSETVSMTG